MAHLTADIRALRAAGYVHQGNQTWTKGKHGKDGTTCVRIVHNVATGIPGQLDRHGWLRMTWRGYWTDEVGPAPDVASVL